MSQELIYDTPQAGNVISKDEVITERFLVLLEDMARQINLSTPIVGVGSPEGTVTAEPYQLYCDSSGAPGAVQYRKMTGDGLTGWVLM